MNTKKRITVADDDRGILDAVGMMHEMEGYDVTAKRRKNQKYTCYLDFC